MSKLVENHLLPYSSTEWDDYARLFSSVTTSLQLAVYKEASTYLKGHVADCGCGAAKISPILAKKHDVFAYTGIDLSAEMVEEARSLLQKLHRQQFSILHSKIEDVSKTVFSSAVSIQSYYAWANPKETLKHIFNMLVSKSIFVLVTPNQNLNLKILIEHAEQELLTHPYFDAYKDYNLKLAANPQANFVSMDHLVRQVREVGFQVEECHQRHFLGGLNFLVLKKDI